MAAHYHLPEFAATAVPILSGHYLARNRESHVVRAFFGAELHLGIKSPGKLTRLQAAFLARVSPTYVCWAEKRMDKRAAIERGAIPLVPPPLVKANGATLAPALTTNIDDAELMHIAHLVGPDRMLAGAVAAGH